MDFLKNIQVHHWPYLQCIWSSITLTITYTVSVSNGHVYKYFPYISDTGTLPPESCIFSQMIDIGSIILGIIFYIRYRQVDFDIKAGKIDIDRKWNTRSAWMAPFICLFFSMVGNFQATVDVIVVFVVHVVAAVMLFAIGITYLFIQTRISFAPRRNASGTSWKYNVSKKILVTRVLFSLALVPLFLIIFSLGALGGTEFTGESHLYWTEEDGGHTYHLVSVFAEWALLILLTAYPVTFVEEFKALKFEEIRFSTSTRSNDVKNNRSKIH